MNLNQITVPALDVEKSISFYQKLGLQLLVHTSNWYARFVCPNGDSTFSVHQVSTLQTGDGVWVYFELENLDTEVESLKNKGLIFETDPEDQVWLWREARLKDPDGNQIILYHAGENRINPPWKLKI